MPTMLTRSMKKKLEQVLQKIAKVKQGESMVK
jgi:hypothetical protein